MLRSILRSRIYLLLVVFLIPSCATSQSKKFQQPCMIDGRPTGEVRINDCDC